MFDALLFILGLGAGFVTHEGGHQITAWAVGDEIRWRSTEWHCVSDCKGATIAMGGFVAPAVADEILLLKSERNTFDVGYLAFNLVHPVVYTIKAEVSSDRGDFGNMSRGQAHVAEAVILTHAASVALRWAWKDKPEWFTVEPRHDGVALRLNLRW